MFIYRFKLLEMKKVLLFVALIATVSFGACTNQKSSEAASDVDSVAVVVEEEVAPVVDTVEVLVDSTAAAVGNAIN